MIHNFRATKVVGRLNFDIELPQQQKLYCFIGENGVGKTTMLEAMAKSLLYIHAAFHKQKRENRYSGLLLKEKINRKIKDYPLHLPASIVINNETVKSVDSNWGITTLKELNNEQLPIECSQPIVFIGAKERGYLSNLQTKKFEMLGDKYDRLLQVFQKTYDSMYGNSTDNGQIAEWFIQRIAINPSFVPEAKIRMDEAIAVLEIMQQLEPKLKLVQLDKNNNKTLSLAYKDGKLLFDGMPFETLPTGFISIIRILQEIISAFGAWGGEKNLNETAGIVFVDEIEAHLHIKWQYRILPLLKETFPNTTFYITTHSSLILSNLEEKEGYKLQQNNNHIQALPIEDINGYFVMDIIKKYFDVDSTEAVKLTETQLNRQREARKALLQLPDSINLEEKAVDNE
jgi:predicted ATPase